MSDSQRPDSLDEFPSESFGLHSSTPEVAPPGRSSVGVRFLIPDASTVARERRRARIRQAMTEADGRDSPARLVTISQLPPMLARMGAALFARLAHRLRAVVRRLDVSTRSVAVSLRHSTLTAIAAFRLVGRMLHPLSVAAAACAMLALIIIAGPEHGPSGAIEPADQAQKTVEVSVPHERRLVTPAVAVATSTAAEIPVSPGTAPQTRPVMVDARAIQTVLNRYRDAVSTLDVAAIRAVWPDADLGTLRREFAGVLEQNVEFEACRISSAEAEATASCDGVIESGFRAGDRRPRVQRRRWQFALRKSGDGWRLVAVDVQRV